MLFGLLPTCKGGIRESKQNGVGIKANLPKHVNEDKRYTSEGDKNRVL